MGRKKFNRSAYKATSVQDLQDQAKELDKKLPGGGRRTDILELKKDGSKNRLRIYPKHPDTKSWIFPKCVHFLPVIKRDKDGKEIKDENGKVVIINKPIFNAKINGNYPFDVVDEYISRVYKKANEIQDKDTRKKYLNLITGYRKGQQFIGGIKAQTKYIVYGELNGDFGRVELPKSVRDQLNTIAADQDEEDGSIVVDPFTDMDDGRMVFIKYHEDADPKDKYKTSIDIKKTSPIDDESLEAFHEEKSLEELYDGVYRSRDFELVCEGLKRFDERSEAALEKFGFDEGYNIFEDEEFLDKMEEFDALLPDDEEEDDDNDHEEEETSEEEEEEVEENEDDDEEEEETEEEESSDELDDMDMKALKAYIKKNELGIRVLPSYKEDQVRRYIREELEMIAEEEEEEEKSKPKARSSRSSRLDKIRGRSKK